MTDRPDFQLFPDDARVLAREAEYQAFLDKEYDRQLKELLHAEAQR